VLHISVLEIALLYVNKLSKPVITEWASEIQFEAAVFAGVLDYERSGRLVKDWTNLDWNLAKDLVDNMELVAFVHYSTAHYSSHKTTVIERRNRHSTSMHRLRRVSVCSVMMLRIRKTGELESRENQLSQVYLENGCLYGALLRTVNYNKKHKIEAVQWKFTNCM